MLNRYYFTNTAAVNTFQQVVTATSPTAYWRLGEPSGTTATDVMGTQNGAYQGSPTLGVTGYATGNTAVTLNGSSQYVSAADHASWDFGTSDFSFMAAINITTWVTATNEAIVGRGTGYSAGRWVFNTDPYGVGCDGFWLQFAGTDYMFRSSGTYVAGGWHLIGVSCDRSGNADLYIDGSLKQSVDISSTVATDMTSDVAMNIGAASQGTPERYLNGSVDEVAFWNNKLITGTQWAEFHAARTVS